MRRCGSPDPSRTPRHNKNIIATTTQNSRPLHRTGRSTVRLGRRVPVHRCVCVVCPLHWLRVNTSKRTHQTLPKYVSLLNRKTYQERAGGKNCVVLTSSQWRRTHTRTHRHNAHNTVTTRGKQKHNHTSTTHPDAKTHATAFSPTCEYAQRSLARSLACC